MTEAHGPLMDPAASHAAIVSNGTVIALAVAFAWLEGSPVFLLPALLSALAVLVGPATDRHDG